MGVPRRFMPNALKAVYDYIDAIVTAGEVTLPDIAGHGGQFLKTNGTDTTDWAEVFPDDTGKANKFLMADGAGNQSWEAVPADPLDFATSRAVTTGADPTAATFTAYEDAVTTGATEGSELYNLGAAPAVKVGHRKLVTLAVRSHASDVVTLDHANIKQGSDTITAVALDAANEFLLVEWRGSTGKWEVIAASAGVVSVS